VLSSSLDNFAKAQAASMPSLAMASVPQQQFSESGGKLFVEMRGLALLAFQKSRARRLSLVADKVSKETKGLQAFIHGGRVLFSRDSINFPMKGNWQILSFFDLCLIDR